MGQKECNLTPTCSLQAGNVFTRVCLPACSLRLGGGGVQCDRSSTLAPWHLSKLVHLMTSTPQDFLKSRQSAFYWKKFLSKSATTSSKVYFQHRTFTQWNNSGLYILIVFLLHFYQWAPLPNNLHLKCPWWSIQGPCCCYNIVQNLLIFEWCSIFLFCKFMFSWKMSMKRCQNCYFIFLREYLLWRFLKSH